MKLNSDAKAAIGIALLSLAMSGFATYSKDSSRLTAVEVKQEGSDKRLERIENKIDDIYIRILGFPPKP